MPHKRCSVLNYCSVCVQNAGVSPEFGVVDMAILIAMLGELLDVNRVIHILCQQFNLFDDLSK